MSDILPRLLRMLSHQAVLLTPKRASRLYWLSRILILQSPREFSKIIPMNRKLKNFIKTTTPPLMNLLTKIQLPFVREKCDKNTEESLQRLNQIWPDHELNLARQNKIVTKKNMMIILPVYNAEKYLHECLNSIFNQKTKYTYDVVAIDDGSTDSSLNILKQHEGKITIIHQENGGAAKARNAGLKEISAEYLMFVDADDLLLPDAIESLLDIAYKENADIVEGTELRFVGACPVKKMKGKVTYVDDVSKLKGYPWGKVFRSSLFENITFPEGWDYEDSIMTYLIYPTCKKVMHTTQAIYGYRDNPSSVSFHTIAKPKVLDTIYISLKMWNMHFEEYGPSFSFNKSALGQITLNHRRLQNLSKEHEDVQKDAFAVLKKAYMSMFPEPSKELIGKMKSLDKAIRKNNYGRYRIISDRWVLLY